jgi:hypothetical protein
MGNLPFFVMHHLNVSGWIHYQAISLRPGQPAKKEMPGVDEVPGVEGLRTNRGAKIFYHKI